MAAGPDLLRFVTMGSVDDGKSTLIGRLLVDSGNLYEDHLGQLEGLRRAGDELEYGLVLDGLHAEREQGITIDVAYRYFSTPRRRFIIADCPGHVQYTRNMATGASGADAAILLVDARAGVLEQTRRHAYISSLLEVGHVIVAVNKMDLVAFDRHTFERVQRQFTEVAERIALHNLSFIPVSALHGDNVVEASARMPWYQGETILERLETAQIHGARDPVGLRFPVQMAVRTGDGFRGYAGTVASGLLRTGAEVVVLPSGRRTRIAGLHTYDGEPDAASAAMAVTVTLTDAVDVSRGDMLVPVEDVPRTSTRLDAVLIWLDPEPLATHQSYVIKHTTRRASGRIPRVHFRFDVGSLERLPAAGLTLNQIGRVSLDLGSPLMVDPYRRNRTTGSFIVIDPRSNRTVGAGLVLDDDSPAAETPNSHATAAPRQIWITGTDDAALDPAHAQRLLTELARHPGASGCVFLALVSSVGSHQTTRSATIRVSPHTSAADLATALEGVLASPREPTNHD